MKFSKMVQQIDLETLHHILEQYSENVLSDCPRIICNLLNSLNETAKPENLKAFKSIKALLNLYEIMFKKDSMTGPTFPINLILENIKKTMCNGRANCNHPDNNMQLELLSILHSAIKISSMENPLEAVQELIKLHDCSMTCISAAIVGKECTTDCVMFNLKLVNGIYNLFGDLVCEPDLVHLCERLQSDNINDKVLADLVLHGDDSVALQTLTFLIPEYIKYFKTDKVLEIIWEKTTDLISQSFMKHSRMMLILCSFFDMFFGKFGSDGKLHLLLFEDGNFWKVLQTVLVKNDPVIRRQGMFVLKKTVEVLTNTDETIICSKESLIFYWDLNFKNDLCKVYKNIITTLEFLDEQQVHIIKPILQSANQLIHLILNCEKVSPSWVLMVHHKALIHDSTQVVRWGLTNLLNLEESFFAQEDIAKETVALLLPVLNSPNIYYGNGLAVSKNLETFLNKMATLDTSRAFFCFFIKQLCSLVWSPESLFFVTNAISFLHGYAFWGEDEISQIRIFVKRTFKTYHKVIRVAIQCNLLNAIAGLTDTKNVSLKNILLLISSFPLMNSVERESHTWKKIISLINKSYSQQEAEQVLQLCKRQELGKEFNNKSISIIFILLYYSFEEEEVSSLVLNHLTETLLSFKDIEKRLYCDKSFFDEQLSVMSEIYAVNVNHSICDMLEPTLFYVRYAISYILTQLGQISRLEEFDMCQLYLNAFENIIKTEKSFYVRSEDIKSLYKEVLNDFETCLHSTSGPYSFGFYCKVKFLNILLTLYPCDAEVTFLISYLRTNVNKPLEKGESCGERSRDIQSLWGRVNSELIEGKWKIFRYLVNNKLIGDRGSVEGEATDWMVKLCVEGLSTGGYGVLCPVMSVLKKILPAMENYGEVREIVSFVWELMMERRKTEEFKFLMKTFVEMLFEEAFVVRGGEAEEILKEYADLIFSKSSLVAITVFVRHIQEMDLATCSGTLFCHIIGKALTFGPVERKDERLTTSVCVSIKTFRICPLWETGLQNDMDENRKEAEQCGTQVHSAEERLEQKKMVPGSPKYHWPLKLSEHYTSGEIRARAVERILRLKKDSKADQAMAEDLVKTLLKLFWEVNPSRERYFGNSHVHRVKHRIMQALLLLEPVLPHETDVRKKLLSRLFESLLNENLQPSVRYLQEWLIIRILVKDVNLWKKLFSYLDIHQTIKKTGLCSLIVIGFHVGLLSSPELSESYIDSYIETVLKFLFHQNFEIRLHAQVVVCKLYEFADTKKLKKVTSRWENILLILNQVCSCMRNQCVTNFMKLEHDFFLNAFHALKHYSLQVIYLDLPRLTNIESDEWIYNSIFQYCGVDPSKMSISLENSHSSLEGLNVWVRRESPNTESEFEEERSEEISENYQRKIIPTKPLMPGWDAEGCGFVGERRDGLVVVASLIDRIPNLGGLARTCEIFGVSEYVLSSLKYVEDKQFTSLSVTAEKWINIKEVKPQNLKFYLLNMKQNGYAIVGAEQTLHSQSLGSVKFPKKTLLILGNEKEGIPSNLLPFLDICVEIPQMGIIRSLNVHVTGALFIWEYAKQIYFS